MIVQRNVVELVDENDNSLGFRYFPSVAARVAWLANPVTKIKLRAAGVDGLIYDDTMQAVEVPSDAPRRANGTFRSNKEAHYARAGLA